MIRLIVALTALALQSVAQPTSTSPAIVFVCEHGAGKSVIATAYFNKLAAERGLPYRATFRGTSPQDDLSARAVAGLKEDGIPVPSGKPAVITDGDVANATHIFAIGCTVPDRARLSGKADDWSDVPDDKGYGPMRDAIVEHVKELLDRLAAH
jgi:arsenate reductase (thioredoxin)